MICLNANFDVSSSNGSLVTANKTKTKCRIHAVSVLFDMLRKKKKA